MAKPTPVRPGAAPGAAPERSATADEHQGLAARILELRAVIEEHRKANVRDVAEVREEVARIKHRQATLERKIDDAMGQLATRQRELDTALRDGAEQVRMAGQLAREMRAKVDALEELRELQVDPHEVVRPVQRAVAQIAADLESLRKNIDAKFERLPRERAAAWEER